MNLTRIQEDYLHIIYELIEEKSYARVKDIAKKLSVKASSVNNMIAKLANLDLVVFEKNGPIRLTKEGQSIAKIVRIKHETFEKFFKILSLPETIAKKDSLKIEHNLHPETIYQLKCFIDYIEKDSEGLKFKKKYIDFCKIK